MSVMDRPAVPIAMFGDLDGDVWGVVVGGERPLAAAGRITGAGLELGPAELDTSDDDVWTLLGTGCDLRVERADATTSGGEGDIELDPCRVSGSIELDGNRREFDVAGIRSAAFTVGGLDSLRVFGAWFPADHQIGVVASRPRGAKGQDRDSITVVARGEAHPLIVDPRLSTTYDHAGAPRRIGLELWLGDDPDGDLWPRRVAGSSTGSSVAGAGLSAYAFECVSRSEPGAGIYLLTRGR
jgi:hypothetical protein